MKMTIQERGDEMLTAYANKDFGTVKDLWEELEREKGDEALIELHSYQNQSITETTIGAAVASAVRAHYARVSE